jgi:hypothetical protein
LHTGGADFQELYYTLIPKNEEKSWKESFEVLDNYFVPKVNVPFERHFLGKCVKLQERRWINMFVG